MEVELCSKIYYEMYGENAFFSNVMGGLRNYTPELLEAYVIKIDDVLYTDLTDTKFITHWEKAVMWETLNDGV